MSRSCDHRDLHSFPTRRSSDLGGILKDPRPGSHTPLKFRRAVFGFVIIDHCPRTALPCCRQIPPNRSEEHTSELQSRENLVCRLLLEKKKVTVRFQGITQTATL